MMDTETGEIHPLIKELAEEQKEWAKTHRGEIIKMMIPPTKRQLSRKPPRVLPREQCPCGSGRKLKHCHLVRGNR